MRIGFGYDFHRLEAVPEGLWLGGVHVPAPFRVIAHSDGDVILHALIDALLGATANGDIGQHFPDSDAAHFKRASHTMLEEVLQNQARGFRVCQVDVTLLLERPKLGPYRQPIRQRLSELLNLALSEIGLKAKTHEGMGEIGQSQAIAAYVLVTVSKRDAEDL